MQQIHHYTLNTGDGRLTDRCEVAAGVIAILRPICDAGGGDLPGNLRIALTRGNAGGYLYTIYRQETPLVTCGLATAEDQAAEIWPVLVKLAGQLDLPRPPRGPRVPWLSVVILPTLALVDRETCGAIADLERCVAWTLIDLESKERPTAG